MKRLISVLLCLVMLFCVVSLMGCSSKDKENVASTRTVIDMSGAEVEIPAQIDK